jgi:hypothetical protein
VTLRDLEVFFCAWAVGCCAFGLRVIWQVWA